MSDNQLTVPGAPGVRRPTWGQPYFPKPGPTGRAYTVYMAQVYKRFRRFTLEGLADTQDSIDLREIYVPLALAETHVEDNASEAAVTANAHQVLWWLERDPCLIISGAPGSGKSTLVRHLVSELCARVTNDATRALPDHLVVPVVLRDHVIAKHDGLDSLIERAMDEICPARDHGHADFAPMLLRPFWDQGRFVILLDGLDELGTVARRRQVWRWLAEFQARQPGQGYYVVTSRPSGLEGLGLSSTAGGVDAIGAMFRGARIAATRIDDPVAGLAGAETGEQAGAETDEQIDVNVAPEPVLGTAVFIRPLDHQGIERFCRRFFDLPSYRRQDGARKADNLLAALRTRADLRELARRPAFVTMMAFVHATIGALPDTRADLYKSLVTAYLHQLERVRELETKLPTGRPDWPHSDLETLLAQLAFLAHRGAHRDHRGRDPWGPDAQDRRWTWTRVELQDTLAELLTQPGLKVARPEHAPLLVTYFLARTGLLFEPTEGVVQFGHLSFQEYLAAVHMHAQALAARSKATYAARHIFAHLEDPGWCEVASLFMAIDARHTQGQGHHVLLCELQLTEWAHIAWLAGLLGGREIALADDERGAWLAGLMAAVMALGSAGAFYAFDALDQRSLAREPDNHAHVARWFQAACVPWDQGSAPRARLRQVLEHEQEATRPTTTSSVLALLAGDALDADTSEPGVLDHLLGHRCALLWSGAGDLANVHGELAGAAALVYYAEAAIPDQALARAVPPELFYHDPEQQELHVWPSYWWLQALLRSDTPRLARTLTERSHLGAWLVTAEPDIPVWQLAEPPGAARAIRLALRTALLCAVRVPDDPWLSSRARALAPAPIPALALIQAWALAPVRARARARAQARAPARVWAPILRVTLSRNLFRVLARAQALAQAQAQALVWALEQAYERQQSDHPELTLLTARTAALLEAMLLTADPRAETADADTGGPLTRERVHQALRVFSDPAWLDDDPDPERRRRELDECRQMGLLPIALLERVLADPALSWPITAQDMAEQLTRDIEAWTAEHSAPADP